MSPSSGATSSQNVAVTTLPARVERRCVAALTVVAAFLRVWGFGRLGLTHFDEGVYALSGLWAVDPSGIAAFNPGVISYAPPVYPLLVGLAYATLGLADVSAIFVSIVLGVATVPAAAWLARRTFGPGAGVAAAVFVTFSLAHLAFSRKALTDAPFLLAWVVALGLGGRFLERPGLGRALAMGLAVGLAQNVKYNGYLAGAVMVIAALAGLVADPASRRRPSVVRTFGFGLVGAAVAALSYWPWYRFVEANGGYDALIRHQRSYLGGTNLWYPHWEQQLAQVVAFSGGFYWGLLVWALAWAAVTFATQGKGASATRTAWDWSRLRIGLVLGGAAIAVVPDLAWWLGLAWSPWLLADRRPSRRVLGVWWVLMSALTPFYHPYARLWLPLHGAGWVLLAGLIVHLGPFSETALSDLKRKGAERRGLLAKAAVGALCVVLARTHWRAEVPRPLPLTAFQTPTDSLRTAVHQIVYDAPFFRDTGIRLRVFARRPVAYYLLLTGRMGFQLVSGKGDLYAAPRSPDEWVLVDEVLFNDALASQADWSGLSRNWSRKRSWNERLDPVTQLDVHPGAAFEAEPLVIEPRLVLYRPRPPRLTRIERPQQAAPGAAPAPTEPGR